MYAARRGFEIVQTYADEGKSAGRKCHSNVSQVEQAPKEAAQPRAQKQRWGKDPSYCSRANGHGGGDRFGHEKPEHKLEHQHKLAHKYKCKHK